MNFHNLIFAVLAFVSLALVLWQWVAARLFPLHKKNVSAGFAPAVSILKPLKGCDETTRESLETWFGQNYAGEVEIIFGVAGAGDPVCEIVRQLMAENPGCSARLVVCGALAGTNAKVSKLAQLEVFAQHDLILISDADVRVERDFLTNMVAPLRDEKNALVNCFYRLANPTTPAMRWEAVAINADFWSQVLQSQTMQSLDFALGAAILMRRKALDEIGGFNSLADYLADDYQLGNRITKNGHRIALCPVVVECWDAPKDWNDVWKHQIRWARTISVCQPWPYFFSILANATLWPFLWFVASFLTASSLGAPLAAIGCIGIRIGLAQNLQRRFTPERKLVSPAWLVPVKDLSHALIWFIAFAGDTVEWRGRRMKLLRDGTLLAES